MSRKRPKITLKVPETYSVETKRFIKIVLRELNERDELNSLMEGVLVMLMNCYETFIDASRTVRQEGATTILTKNDVLSTHPAVGTQLKSNQQVLALMKELGLTTKSRRVLDNAKEDSSMLSLFTDLADED